MPPKQPAKQRTRIISLGLISIVLVVGYFVFMDWRSQTEIIDQGDYVIEQQANTTNERAAIRTPLVTDQAPNRISIPDRDITDVPIIYVDKKTETAYQEALANGVVHYPGTADIGEYGNPYIFGHSSDYFWKPGEYKQVFKNLIDISVGTQIIATNAEGEQFIYEVIETKIVGPEEVSVLDQQNYERQLLTLQTSYPLNTAWKRYIAVAELDESATYGPGSSQP